MDVHMRSVLLVFGLLAVGCETAVTVDAGLAEPGTIGAACEAAADCDRVSGASAVGGAADDEGGGGGASATLGECLRMPEGYCATTCLWQADCPAQSICDDLGDPLKLFCLDGCLTDDDCREQYWCDYSGGHRNTRGESAGVCRAKCTDDGACRPGFKCDKGTGRCVAESGEAVGMPCTEGAVCKSGTCLSGFPSGGYCSATCGSGKADRCEAGSVCVSTGAAVANCMATCEGFDAACRVGYACVPRSERFVCYPRCEADADCPTGQACKVDTGECVEAEEAPAPETGRAVGAGCAQDGQCEGGKCRTGEDWTGGACVTDCDNPGGECGVDGAQGRCLDWTRGGEQVCVRGCSLDADCRGGYVCEEGGCLPACRAGTCDGELVCDTSSGRCLAAPPDEPAQAEVETLDLGSVTVGPRGSDTLELSLPAGAQGAAVIATGTAGELMTVGKLTDPSGRTLYDFHDPMAGVGIRVLPAADVLTLLLPMTPRVPLAQGKYRLSYLRNGSDKSVQVSAHVKKGDAGAQLGGTLDVRVHLVGVPGLNAAGAEGHAKLGQAVQVFRSRLGATGVTIGDIDYRDADGADATRLSTIDSIEGPSSELAALFKLSEGQPDRLHLFLVEEIVSGDAGFILLGLAGGIPGPPIPGSGASGVAVTAALLASDPASVGRTMAHETGHYLGLFHTSERNGSAHDPIPDTPECRPTADGNSDGMVVASECREKGAGNLMFWSADDNADDLSADQGWVVARNPLVR